MVLGSRYQDGHVNVVNWPMSRLFLSYAANVYARFVTGLPIFDTTGGFKCFRRNVLESIDLNSVKSNGYAFQIEMSFPRLEAGLPALGDPDHLRRPDRRCEQDVQEDRPRGRLDGLASALVEPDREDLMAGRLEGQRFYKMTGSGNDFVVFDATQGSTRDFENEETIRSLSARGTGVGADGVVFVEKAGEGDVRMRYYNSDGSEAALCGNASLCSTRLAVELGLAQAGGFVLHTAAGSLKARIRDGLPEVDLEAVREVKPDASDLGQKPGELRLGYACAGVPHVVVEISDIESADVTGRGPELRNHPALAEGANVNFVVEATGWKLHLSDLRARGRGRDSGVRDRRRGDGDSARRAGVSPARKPPFGPDRGCR